MCASRALHNTWRRDCAPLAEVSARIRSARSQDTRAHVIPLSRVAEAQRHCAPENRLRIKPASASPSSFFGGFIAPTVGFLMTRPPLDANGWAFLQKQRPRLTSTPDGTEMSVFIVPDGLNFALARRPIRGWETDYVTAICFSIYPRTALQILRSPCFSGALRVRRSWTST